MKLLAGIAFAAVALSVASAARAEEPAADASKPRARVEAGFGVLALREKEDHIRQSRLTLAPEFSLGPRLRLAPLMRMTTTTIDLLQKDSMMFDATLSFPWQPSLGARARYDAFDWKMLHLDLMAEFEFPLGQNRAWLSSFTPKGDIAKLDIDIDTLRNHVTVDHDWHSFQMAMRIRSDFGWAHPYADFGYIMMTSRVAVNFDATASSMLRDAKLSPNRFYGAGKNSPFYMVGSEFDLGKDLSLRVQGMVLPSSDKTSYVGEGTIIIPIDP